MNVELIEQRIQQIVRDIKQAQSEGKNVAHLTKQHKKLLSQLRRIRTNNVIVAGSIDGGNVGQL